MAIAVAGEGEGCLLKLRPPSLMLLLILSHSRAFVAAVSRVSELAALSWAVARGGIASCGSIRLLGLVVGTRFLAIGHGRIAGGGMGWGESRGEVRLRSLVEVGGGFGFFFCRRQWLFSALGAGSTC